MFPCKRFIAALVLILTGFFDFSAIAHEIPKANGVPLGTMDIEELLECKVKISSLKPLTTRKAPGVITVVTREQIVQSGARDLLEVLRLFFPGFRAMNIFQGAVLGGFRGIDYRVLLMIDGMEVTEEFAERIPLGNEYPVNSIERIEIMRGPGSVLYGGFASNAVVNIISRKASGNGFITYSGSHARDSFTHNNLTVGVGKDFPGSEFNLIGMIGKGNRSDRNNIDYYGDSMSMTGNHKLDPEHLHVQFRTDRGFEIQALSRNYLMSNINLWGVNHRSGAIAQSFRTQAFEVKNRFDLGEKGKWILVPRLFYKNEVPWRISVTDVAPLERYESNKRIERVTFELTTQGELDNRTDAKLGYSSSRYLMELPENPGPYEEPLLGGRQRLSYHRDAFFGEILHDRGPLLLSLGGRFERSSKFGNAFAPRLILTRGWKKLNLKLAKSRSVRIPGGLIENRHPPGFPNLKPEVADVHEIELSYKFSGRTYVSVNLFDLEFEDLIQYTFDINSVGFFSNMGKLGTKGLEFELMHNFKRVRLLLNYAYYRANRNDVVETKVPGHPGVTHGFPQHALNALVSIDMGNGWLANPSVSWFGERFGFDRGLVTIDAQGNPLITDVLKRYSPKAIWNVNFHKDYGDRGMSFDVGIHDLFDSGYSFLTPAAMRVAPLPGPTRAISVRAEINRKF